MISLIQHFEADFLWIVSLKTLNSGIILKLSPMHMLIYPEWLLFCRNLPLLPYFAYAKAKAFERQHVCAACRCNNYQILVYWLCQLYLPWTNTADLRPVNRAMQNHFINNIIKIVFVVQTYSKASIMHYILLHNYNK